MKISFNWLSKYTNFTITPNEAAAILTSIGLEVESLEKVGGGERLKGIVIGKVVSCEKHPNADKLKLTSVDIGGETPLSIVCGASNVAEGCKVAVATIGSRIFTSDTEYFEIKKSKIRGITSEGMLCSEKELGISNSNEGIMLLAPNANIGARLEEYLAISEDVLFEIGITPNRADATSHIGVARDLIAGYNLMRGKCERLNYPSIPFDQQRISSPSPFTVTIEDTDACPRYAAICLTDVKVENSPAWLQQSLHAVGIKPINTIVDVTNFVMMEMGQPLHAFDFASIKGRAIHVKKAPKDTSFTTLDANERKLNGEELMIYDVEKPLCIAGVLGGSESGIQKNTTSVLLESAYFKASDIRKTSKYHGIKTDASFRFERGCDPEICVLALKRAALLLREICGAKIESAILDYYPKPIQKAQIDISYDYITKLTGKEIPIEILKAILSFLEIEIIKEDEKGMCVLIPTNKPDVTRPCDLVEEILRIYGYHQIEVGEEMSLSVSYSQKPDSEYLQELISTHLSSNGFTEIMNNSLSKSAYYEKDSSFVKEENVYLMNPLSQDLNMLRRTLLYGGLETLAYNLNRKILDQKLYEFGNIYRYLPENKESQQIRNRYQEKKQLSLWICGQQYTENWKYKNEKSDLFLLKAYVESLLKRTRVDLTPFSSTRSKVGFALDGLEQIQKQTGNLLYRICSIHPDTLKTFDIKQEVFYAEIDWDELIRHIPSKEILYQEVSKYPEVRRDLALLVNESTQFKDIEKVAFEVEKTYLKKIGLFDVYKGSNIGDDKKSYAISLILADEKSTLDEYRIEGLMQKLEQAFEDKLGARIRKGDS